MAGRYCNFSDRYIVYVILLVFTKACELTVIIGCFDLLIDLALQVSGFVFSSTATYYASKSI